MEVQFRQTKPGHCTVYMWANLIGDCAVLKFTEDPRFRGCGEKEQAEVLADFLPEIKMVQVCGVDCNYPGIHINHIWGIVSFKDPEKPFKHTAAVYVLTVRLYKEIDMYHSVAIANYNDELFYLDPYKENWLLLENAEQLSSLFFKCSTIERPALLSDNKYVSFNARQLHYPFVNLETV